MNSKHDQDYRLEPGVGRLQDGAEVFFDRTRKYSSSSYNEYFASIEAVLDVMVHQPLLMIAVSALSGVVAGIFLRRVM